MGRIAPNNEGGWLALIGLAGLAAALAAALVFWATNGRSAPQPAQQPPQAVSAPAPDTAPLQRDLAALRADVQALQEAQRQAQADLDRTADVVVRLIQERQERK